ncbi:YecA family protein [Algivirga pacifica]|uniref:SEC-C motif-containing protein n=1 Tax=Algivirga pacifica TaxID=1162670 RepID=A0ABP9DM07_9BACT
MKKSSHSKYIITKDPAKADNKKTPIPEELKSQMPALMKEAKSGTAAVEKKLQALIKTYPDIPVLKNMLTGYYKTVGNMEKALEVNQQTFEEHPDYLYARINTVGVYVDKKDFVEVEKLLGNEFELPALYPERKAFHIDEFLAYYLTVVNYAIAAGKIDLALEKFDLMNQLDPNSPQVQKATELLAMETMGHLIGREDDHLMHVKERNNPKSKKKKQPQLQNEALNFVYEKTLEETSDKDIEQVMALPKASLIEDLKIILEDSINRFNHFNKSIKENGEEESQVAFLQHAFLILAELKASEALPETLEVLRQNGKVLNLYLEHFLHEYMSHVILRIGKNELGMLKQFMKEKGINLFAKLAVVEATLQVALHDPERKQEVEEWFEEILEFFKNAQPEDNVIDSALLGTIMSHVIDGGFEHLLPLTEEVYNTGYVDEIICGDYEAFKQSFLNQEIETELQEDLSIYQIYEEERTLYMDVDDLEIEKTSSEKGQERLITVPLNKVGNTRQPKIKKIGRNDPCPCGSGKKFKKCCMA